MEMEWTFLSFIPWLISQLKSAVEDIEGLSFAEQP
jgi:hypothetical protein